MSFPITANLEDSLKVDIHLHEFYLGDRDRFCWTYMTRGMDRYGQAEMALSLLVKDKADKEKFPKTPVKMFELLAKRAADGRLVNIGDSTRLGKSGIFGFPGLFYAPAIQYPDLPALDKHLALILVHQDEYDFARRYGVTRFLSRLGKYCSSFPYPTWNTEVRPSLIENANESSVLTGTRAVDATRSQVQQLDDAVQFRLHPNDAAATLTALESAAASEPVIIKTAYSTQCDATLYWQTDQPEPGAYAAPESASNAIGGSFIAFEKSAASASRIVEDGYSVCLGPTQWQTVLSAINNRQGAAFSLDNGQRFVLTPINIEKTKAARGYEPVAAWLPLVQSPLPTVKQTPEDAADTNTNASAAENTRVVTSGAPQNHSAEDLNEAVTRAALADYLARIERTFNDAMSEETATFSFSLLITVDTDGARASVKTDASLNPEFVSFIEATVKTITPCEVTLPIRFTLPIDVNRVN